MLLNSNVWLHLFGLNFDLALFVSEYMHHCSAHITFLPPDVNEMLLRFTHSAQALLYLSFNKNLK